MTRSTGACEIYDGATPPRSQGRVTLAEMMQACCLANWIAGADILEAMLRGDGTGPVAAARDMMRSIGELAIDGRIRTWARPFGGGSVAQVPTVMWEIDDYEPRARKSAFNLERWAEPRAEPTHWIFVDSRDMDAVVGTLRAADEAFEAAGSTRDRLTAKNPVQTSTVVMTTLTMPTPIVSAAPEVPARVRARRFLKIKDVTAATKLSKSRIYEKMKLGTFPDCVKWEREQRRGTKTKSTPGSERRADALSYYRN